MMHEPSYLSLAKFYEQCLEIHGTVPKGMDWPNENDLIKRFKVMLELFEHDNEPVHLLDLGCGYGALIDHLVKGKYENILYTGMDISEKMISSAKVLFPCHQFILQDILLKPLQVNHFDYIIMNGLLTEKRSLSWDEMTVFARRIISHAFKACKKGIAFNVMNYHVDWCNPNLFYWSFDDAAKFLIESCTRNIVFRQDYGLYEYTVYVYKNA